MRIGIDASCLPPFVAGAGRYICGLVAALSNHDSNNEYFVFVKQRDLGLVDNLGPNFQKVTLPNFDRPRRIAWQLFQPRHLTKQFKLDIWHAPHYTVPRDLKDVHLVVTFHDMTFFLFPTLYSPTRRWFFQNTITDATRRADTIVAVSQTTKQDIETVFPHASSRLVHVYSGVARNGFSCKEKNGAADIDCLERGTNLILFLGTLERRKNVPLLINAFAGLLRNGRSNLKLIVAGQRGNAHNEIAASIKSLGLTEHVILPGYLNEAELRQLYSAASLFVYPSLYEGFGFPVLEAMASGTPVLTSNNSSMQEVAQIKEILLDPSRAEPWTQKMTEVLDDPVLQRRLIQHGVERAKELSWENTAQQMLNVYRYGTSACPTNNNGKLLSSEKEKQHIIAVSEPSHRNGFARLTAISKAILQTISYSDLFDYPLTALEIHSGLIAERATLAEVQTALLTPALAKYIQHDKGFFFLNDRAHLLGKRTAKQPTSLELLHRNRRLLKFVSHFPFVRGAALSGAMAFQNCSEQDDIDLFLIVDGKRIWLTYLCLTVILKLLGKRTLICLNYLYGKANLEVNTRNFFVAHQIANLRPLAGNGIFQSFFKANFWVRNYLPQSTISTLQTAIPPFALKEFEPTKLQHWLLTLAEKFLGISAFDRVEALIYKRYSRHIRILTKHLNGSVAVEPDQIKLFTNDHRERVMKKWREKLAALNGVKP